jgi:hypothetical protein
MVDLKFLENLRGRDKNMTKKMTQYQQVVNALIKIGGKGTNKDICANIDFSGWNASHPENSVSRYLTTMREDFKKVGGIWVLQDGRNKFGTSQAKTSKTTSKKTSGIYVITVSPTIKITYSGFIFKIGSSKDIKERMKGYNASLPVETVHLIGYYLVPDSIDPGLVEKQVRGELIGNGNLGGGYFGKTLTIQPYYTSNQREWMQITNFQVSSDDDLNKLMKLIGNIVKVTIKALIP